MFSPTSLIFASDQTSREGPRDRRSRREGGHGRQGRCLLASQRGVLEKRLEVEITEEKRAIRKEEIKKATPLPGPGHYYKFELLLSVALTRLQEVIA